MIILHWAIEFFFIFIIIYFSSSLSLVFSRARKGGEVREDEGFYQYPFDHLVTVLRFGLYKFSSIILEGCWTLICKRKRKKKQVQSTRIFFFFFF